MTKKINLNNVDLEKYLVGLNPEERAIALQTLQEFTSDKQDLYEKLYKADYREIPVSPEQFLDDPQYFNHIGKSLYPIWRKHFIDINNNPLVYYIILTGSIGCGKDFFTYLLLAYEIYKIGCLRNPHDFFERAENTNIVVSLISITKTQTKKVLFEPLKNAIDGSPWFQKYFPRNKDKNDIIEFMSPADNGMGKYGKISVEYGAPNNSSVIGENVITAAMDEANFMQVVEKSKKVRGVNKEFNQAKNVHDNILRRMESRYLKKGKMPGKLILLSSRQYPDDFVEKKIQEVKPKEYACVCEHSFYEVKRDQFKEEEFRVLVGNERYASRILTDNEVVADPNAEIINVPMDFIERFETDLDGSIRDIAGRATLAVQNFLRDRAKVYDCMDKEHLPIFSADVTTLEDGEHLLNDNIALIDKSAPRAIHLDLSSTGCSTGFTMAHICDMREISHVIETVDIIGGKTMKKVTEMLPVYKVDLMLEVKPPANGEIKYSLIRQLIHDLRELGFSIHLITADQYQSKDMLQILSDNNFETAYLSVDTSLEPYYNLRTAIYENRIQLYKHDTFIDEIINLEENMQKRKIEKRTEKSKDVSDSVAGACWSLSQIGITNMSAKIKPSQGGNKEAVTDEIKTPIESCEDFENEMQDETAYKAVNKNEFIEFNNKFRYGG